MMYLLTDSSDKMLFQVMKKMTMWLLSVHTVIWDLFDFRFNLYVVLHFVSSLFYVLAVA